MHFTTNKKLFILCFCFVLYVPHITLAHADSFVVNEPRFEVLDLKKAGSLANPYITPDIMDINYIYEFKFVLHFTAISYSIGKFGNDSALTNGINIFYNNNSLLNNNNITSNDAIDNYFSDFRLQHDDNNPKNYQIVATYSFHDELLITPNFQLKFYVQDDITALTSVNECYAHFEGYNKILYNQQDLKPIQQDWLSLISNAWFKAGLLDQITILLLGIAGTLAVWVTFRRLRDSV